MVRLAWCAHRCCEPCLRQYLAIEIFEARVPVNCPVCHESMHPSGNYILLLLMMARGLAHAEGSHRGRRFYFSRHKSVEHLESVIKSFGRFCRERLAECQTEYFCIFLVFYHPYSIKYRLHFFNMLWKYGYNRNEEPYSTITLSKTCFMVQNAKWFHFPLEISP